MATDMPWLALLRDGAAEAKVTTTVTDERVRESIASLLALEASRTEAEPDVRTGRAVGVARALLRSADPARPVREVTR